MTTIMPRAFHRPEGEEEITPPYIHKSQSYDESLSVAFALTQHAAGVPVSAGPLGVSTAVQQSAGGSSDPGSPTLHAAADALRKVTSASTTMDNAADCLMLLMAAADSPSTAAGAATSCGGGKRKHAAAQPAPRRRLKMRSTEPSPLGISSRSSAHGAPTASTEPPVKLLSNATLEQLQLLAAAFKLCQDPTQEQYVAISKRVGITIDQLTTWFQSRKVLQDWVQQQPRMSAADLMSMFYETAEAV